MMEVLWAGAGNASRLRALVKDGRYHGARIIDIEPSEHFGVDPLSILWTHGPKAELADGSGAPRCVARARRDGGVGWGAA